MLNQDHNRNSSEMQGNFMEQSAKFGAESFANSKIKNYGSAGTEDSRKKVSIIQPSKMAINSGQATSNYNSQANSNKNPATTHTKTTYSQASHSEPVASMDDHEIEEESHEDEGLTPKAEELRSQTGDRIMRHL